MLEHPGILQDFLFFPFFFTNSQYFLRENRKKRHVKLCECGQSAGKYNKNVLLIYFTPQRLHAKYASHFMHSDIV